MKLARKKWWTCNLKRSQFNSILQSCFLISILDNTYQKKAKIFTLSQNSQQKVTTFPENQSKNQHQNIKKMNLKAFWFSTRGMKFRKWYLQKNIRREVRGESEEEEIEHVGWSLQLCFLKNSISKELDRKKGVGWEIWCEQLSRRSIRKKWMSPFSKQIEKEKLLTPATPFSLTPLLTAEI